METGQHRLLSRVCQIGYAWNWMLLLLLLGQQQQPAGAQAAAATTVTIDIHPSIHLPFLFYSTEWGNVFLSPSFFFHEGMAGRERKVGKDQQLDVSPSIHPSIQRLPVCLCMFVCLWADFLWDFFFSSSSFRTRVVTCINQIHKKEQQGVPNLLDSRLKNFLGGREIHQKSFKKIWFEKFKFFGGRFFLCFAVTFGYLIRNVSESSLIRRMTPPSPLLLLLLLLPLPPPFHFSTHFGTLKLKTFSTFVFFFFF